MTRAEIDGHIFRVRSPVNYTTPQGTVEGGIASDNYGFGFGVVRFTGIVETLLVSSVTPIDGEYVDVRFSFTTKKLGNDDATAGVGKAFIAEIERQLGQDIPIWENKVMKIAPGALRRRRPDRHLPPLVRSSSTSRPRHGRRPCARRGR